MKPISLVLPGGNSFSQAHSGPGQENPAAKRGWKQLWDSRCGWIGEGSGEADQDGSIPWMRPERDLGSFPAHSLLQSCSKPRIRREKIGSKGSQHLSQIPRIQRETEGAAPCGQGIPGMVPGNFLDAQPEHFGMWESSGVGTRDGIRDGIWAGTFHGTQELVRDEGMGMTRQDR